MISLKPHTNAGTEQILFAGSSSTSQSSSSSSDRLKKLGPSRSWQGCAWSGSSLGDPKAGALSREGVLPGFPCSSSYLQHPAEDGQRQEVVIPLCAVRPRLLSVPCRLLLSQTPYPNPSPSSVLTHTVWVFSIS